MMNKMLPARRGRRKSRMAIRAAGLALGMVAATILAGCGATPSLHPLYTKKSKTYDPALLGTWTAAVPTSLVGSSGDKGKDGNRHTPVSIRLATLSAEGAGSSSDVGYKITAKIGEDVHWYRGVLTEIDDQLYMDIVTMIQGRERETELMNMLLYGEMVQTYVIYRLKHEGDKLQLAYFGMYSGWKKRKPHLAHETPDQLFSGRVVTASTADLRKFLARHASKKGVFFVLGTFEREAPNAPKTED